MIFTACSTVLIIIPCDDIFAKLYFVDILNFLKTINISLHIMEFSYNCDLFLILGQSEAIAMFLSCSASFYFPTIAT